MSLNFGKISPFLCQKRVYVGVLIQRFPHSCVVCVYDIYLLCVGVHHMVYKIHRENVYRVEGKIIFTLSHCIEICYSIVRNKTQNSPSLSTFKFIPGTQKLLQSSSLLFCGSTPTYIYLLSSIVCAHIQAKARIITVA